MSDPVAREPLIAVCADALAASEALAALLASGIDATRVSLVGRPRLAAGQAAGIYSIGHRLMVGGALGSPWREAWSRLTSPALFLLPTVGMVATAGPFSLSIAAGLRGADGQSAESPLALALWSIGASRDQAIDYEAVLRADGLLIVTQLPGLDRERVRSTLAALPTVQAAVSLSSP